MARKSQGPAAGAGQGGGGVRGETRAHESLRLQLWSWIRFRVRDRPLEGISKSNDLAGFFMRTIPAAVWQAVQGQARRREPGSGVGAVARGPGGGPVGCRKCLEPAELFAASDVE